VRFVMGVSSLASEEIRTEAVTGRSNTAGSSSPAENDGTEKYQLPKMSLRGYDPECAALGG